MKTKSQKQEELKKGEKALSESRTLIFIDFGKVSAENLRRLRREVKKASAELLVMKKRLLNVLFKKHNIDFDATKFKSSVGTIFSEEGIDNLSGPIFKFFASLGIPEGAEKDLHLKKIIGGYDIQAKNFFEAAKIVAIGKLPSRDILLGQLVGVISFPVKSLLYILKQKSEQRS